MALKKMAMLIKDLPVDSPHQYGLKRTFINFWYFTLINPAVSYEHRDNQQRLGRASYHGK
jgi:hypothetical protein